MSARDVFTRIYRDNCWGDAESRSGPGSTVFRTRLLRPALSAMFEKLRVHSIVDVPCGDFNWMRLTPLNGISYIGIDIVPEVIEQNNRLYSDASRRFLCLDMVNDSLPRADLILCRDGLVHLSFSDTSSALRRMRQSGAQYLLATTFADHQENEDTGTGGWRPLNLQAPPFDFPQPLDTIWDGPRSDGTYPDKMLALYGMAGLPDLSGADGAEQPR